MKEHLINIELLDFKVHACRYIQQVRMDVILTIGVKISSKSTHFFCWKSFTTMWALYFGGFWAFPFGSSINSYVWFSGRESISSCMGLNHLRLWVSFFASSKLSRSRSSISSTCSASGNLHGGGGSLSKRVSLTLVFCLRFFSQFFIQI